MARRLSKDEADTWVAEAWAAFSSPLEECLYWEEVEGYPVKKFTEWELAQRGKTTSRKEWVQWLEMEREKEPDYYAEMEASWLRDHRGFPPVFVAEYEGNVLDIGDGWHRAALAVAHGTKTIRAVVGRKCKSEE
jgi:hypothetical protein